MTDIIALLLSGITLGAVYIIVALGILVIYKASGVVSVAQFGLVALGGYVAYWGIDGLGLSLPLSYVFAIAVLAIVGVLLERVAYAPLRSRPLDVVILSTLAGGFAIIALLTLWQGAQPRRLASPVGSGTSELLGAVIPNHSFFVIGVTGLTVLILGALFGGTPVGRQLRAIAADRTAARLQGIRTKRLSMLAFAIGGGSAALAGLLLAPISALSPDFGFNPMLLGIGAAIIGGFGRLWGIVLGGLVLGVVQQLASGYVPTLPDEIYPYLILLLVIAIKPEGFLGGEASARL